MAKKLSRKKRLQEVIKNLSGADCVVENCKVEVEELKDELQDWIDNMPENLQAGSKAQELEEAISLLDDLYNSMDEITGSICTISEDSANIEFPGMM